MCSQRNGNTLFLEPEPLKNRQQKCRWRQEQGGGFLEQEFLHEGGLEESPRRGAGLEHRQLETGLKLGMAMLKEMRRGEARQASPNDYNSRHAASEEAGPMRETRMRVVVARAGVYGRQCTGERPAGQLSAAESQRAQDG